MRRGPARKRTPTPPPPGWGAAPAPAASASAWPIGVAVRPIFHEEPGQLVARLLSGLAPNQVVEPALRLAVSEHPNHPYAAAWRRELERRAT